MATPATPQPSGVLVKMAAFVIERTCKNYVATIAGVLLALAVSLPAWTQFIPAKYQAGYAAGIAFCLLLGGALAKFK